MVDTSTGPEAVSEYIAWLRSLHEPTLRVTAAVCFGLGVALVAGLGASLTAFDNSYYFNWCAVAAIQAIAAVAVVLVFRWY
jgi:hypothetical protein